MSAEKDREPLLTVPSQTVVPAGAVFISYASQDAEAAKHICDALRAAGIEVWFDQSELRGGDAWDHKIRDQIHDCRLFIPVISVHTESRDEGYFRREWSLAVDRTRDMAHQKAFLVPVVIDGTPERGATVPDKFHEFQWTQLLSGETPPAFVERIRRLLTPDAAPATTAALPWTNELISVPAARRSSSSKAAIWVTGAVAAVACAYFAADKFWLSKLTVGPGTAAVLTAPQRTPTADGAAPFSPPPHSIAVLPFVNMSGGKDQEYFSDGLTEELLNSLARIEELQVAARTSSFSFKGKDADLATIAHKLNVASILEGSVRRSGRKIRVTAQLNNSVTGFHLWSQTYDRDLSDALQLQAEIANAVASALKVTLLADVTAKIQAGGTRNPQAFDAYLRASRAGQMVNDFKDYQAALALWDETVRLDPEYALAFADRAIALGDYATQPLSAQARQDALTKAQADARKALELAPDFMEGHRALGYVLAHSLDFGAAAKEYDRALALGSGNARLLRLYGVFAVNMGWTDAGLAALHRAVVLDPLSRNQHRLLAQGLYSARRYEESNSAYRDALTLDPGDTSSYVGLGANYFLLGDIQSALSWCEAKPAVPDPNSSACLAVIYHRVGRHSDAEAALAKFRSATSDTDQYSLAQIYASWGDTVKALECLENAMRARQPDLTGLKTEAFLDPLRKEPRFQAIERTLKFP